MIMVLWSVKTCARVERRDWRPAKCRTSWKVELENSFLFHKIDKNSPNSHLVTLNTLSMRITLTNRRTLPARPIIRESWENHFVKYASSKDSDGNLEALEKKSKEVGKDCKEVDDVEGCLHIFSLWSDMNLYCSIKSIIAPSGKSTSLASKQTGWDILNKVFQLHYHSSSPSSFILHCHRTNLQWRKPLSGGQWPSVRGFPVKTLDLWSQWWLRWRYRLPFVNMRHNGGVGDHQVLLVILVQLCQRIIFGSKSCCSWCKPILMTKAPGIVVRIKTAVETSTKSREVKA